MRCRRDDVVLVLFPNSDQRSAKRRPALVVQADALRTGGLNQTIVAMITTNLTRVGRPSRVLIDITTPQGRSSGLQSTSVILTDNLATIHNDEVDRKVGEWRDMDAVDSALRVTLGL